jgi:hypothetical protein
VIHSTNTAALIAHLLPVASGIGWLVARASSTKLVINLISDLPDDVTSHIADAATIELIKCDLIKKTRVYRTDEY